MKKLALIFIMLCLPVYAADDSDKKLEPQKFKGTITIVYNSITLAQMSELENIVRESHKKACRVKITMESDSDLIFVDTTVDDRYIQ